METTSTEAPLELGTDAPVGEEVRYETCDQCNEPVDAQQRYCVVCGARRRHVYDPAAAFLAGATARARSGAGTGVGGTGSRGDLARGRGGARETRTFGLAPALAAAVIPVALAGGILLGRSGQDTNSKVLAALREQKPTVVNVTGGGAPTADASTGTTGTGSTVAALTSDFALQRGYAVELETLPRVGTTRASVGAAERAARGKGAATVGVITQTDFRVIPAPPAGAYVIYSGQYHTRSQATAALAKLRSRFASAKVIQVVSTSAAASTPVVARSAYGTAHRVVGFKPTASQQAQGSQVVQKVSKEISSNYVQSQRGLPDSISVP